MLRLKTLPKKVCPCLSDPCSLLSHLEMVARSEPLCISSPSILTSLLLKWLLSPSLSLPSRVSPLPLLAASTRSSLSVPVRRVARLEGPIMPTDSDAGAAGLSAANQVYNAFKAQGKTLADGDVAIVDANRNHDYQPGWTLVGSGLASKETYRRPLSSLIGDQFAHIPQNAAGFEPGANQVVLADGSKIGYDYLIVGAGLQISESL